ncbi:hypothetical protein RIF29_06880 [Crotalaria pallida]|uniref:Uncharacterized protein n=1 Tax=Crotalaria pallida TaxID=3830 RepID=A0AAN9PAJ8_CROPI
MTKLVTILTLLVTLTVSYSTYVLLHDQKFEGFFFCVPAALPLAKVAIIIIVASAMILASRATVMMWITVLVLLAFAGNRRKVLVKRGWGITLDVAWYSVSVIFTSQKGLFALACATLVSLLATYR